MRSDQFSDRSDYPKIKRINARCAHATTTTAMALIPPPFLPFHPLPFSFSYHCSYFDCDNDDAPLPLPFFRLLYPFPTVISGADRDWQSIWITVLCPRTSRPNQITHQQLTFYRLLFPVSLVYSGWAYSIRLSSDSDWIPSVHFLSLSSTVFLSLNRRVPSPFSTPIPIIILVNCLS